jgi:integrase
VSPKTIVRYQQIVRLHLSPALGGVLLPKLTSLHVQSYYAKALKSGRIQRKRATPKKKRRSRAKPEPQPTGLSPMTVLHHHRVLSEALKQAVRWNLVIRNVCDAVQPPKPAREPMRTLDAKEVHGLLAKAEGTRLHLPILLAVHTGMRRGELLALRWRNIDLDAKTLSCIESLQWVNGAALFKGPKTQRGRRVVMLSETAVTALRRHHKDQTAARLLQGKNYRDQDLVFAGERGEPWNPESFASSWQRFIGKTDYKVRFHDLRHTCATLLLGQGVHPKVVSEMLGHSTVAITLDTYSHVLPSMQEDAVQRLEAALSVNPD